MGSTGRTTSTPTDADAFTMTSIVARPDTTTGVEMPDVIEDPKLIQAGEVHWNDLVRWNARTKNGKVTDIKFDGAGHVIISTDKIGVRTFGITDQIVKVGRHVQPEGGSRWRRR